MTACEKRFMRKRRSLREMASATMLLVVFCVVVAALLAEIPLAIDAELKVSAVPSYLSREQQEEMSTRLIVADYLTLRNSPAANR